eukprot:scaffold95324_cov28-Tisochrysis_lutea.AAC.1
MQDRCRLAESEAANATPLSTALRRAIFARSCFWSLLALLHVWCRTAGAHNDRTKHRHKKLSNAKKLRPKGHHGRGASARLPADHYPPASPLQDLQQLPQSNQRSDISSMVRQAFILSAPGGAKDSPSLRQLAVVAISMGRLAGSAWATALY